MRIFGLNFPLPSHRRMLTGVFVALAVVAGQALGFFLSGQALEREAAIATFCGVLYLFVVDQFISQPGSQLLRYGVAGAGFITLITVGATVFG